MTRTAILAAILALVCALAAGRPAAAAEKAVTRFFDMDPQVSQIMKGGKDLGMLRMDLTFETESVDERNELEKFLPRLEATVSEVVLGYLGARGDQISPNELRMRLAEALAPVSDNKIKAVLFRNLVVIGAHTK